MATLPLSFSKFNCSLIIIFFCFQFSFIASFEFEVGGKHGWVVPKSKNNSGMYNDWASKNRFQINDTIHFRYGKDSVMVVTQEEYEKCRSSRPLFFSNNGDTTFRFDRSGLFYFISGVGGHCERGQKMIIKVLEPESHPPSANENSTDTPSSGAFEMATKLSFAFIVPMLVAFGA